MKSKRKDVFSLCMNVNTYGKFRVEILQLWCEGLSGCVSKSYKQTRADQLCWAAGDADPTDAPGDSQ
jgi:hypothetical protein